MKEINETEKTLPARTAELAANKENLAAAQLAAEQAAASSDPHASHMRTATQMQEAAIHKQEQTIDGFPAQKAAAEAAEAAISASAEPPSTDTSTTHEQ